MDFPTLLIGDTDRPEFREPAAWLIEDGALAVADTSSAIESIQGDFNPALIVIAESWPGQFSHQELDKLRHAAPLVRIMGLLGSWLEGETRTGKPWPTLLRTYWHQAPARLERELEATECHDGPAWSLPLTASEDEKLSPTVGDLQSELHSSIVIAIYSRHRETAEVLSDVCSSCGWQPLWLRSLPTNTPLRVGAVLLDLARGNPMDMKTIATLKAITEDAPIIALVGFPRADDIECLRSAGVAAVVSKPFLVADLVWQINEQLRRSASVHV